MLIKKFWNKLFNYKNYKFLKHNENIKKTVLEFKTNVEPYLIEIEKKINSNRPLSFLHSGHAGDVINALPVIKEISKNHECNLYIQTNKPLETHYHKHPSKDVYLNEKSFEMLEPLLKVQKFIKKIEKYNQQKIDINFDLFRTIPINILFDNLRYASQITGVQPNFDEKYLDAPSHDKLKDQVVIQRTFRYRNQFINYQFLNDFKDIYFVGNREEYNDLKKTVLNLKFYECKDFLDMASAIKSSKFFIGNSSVGFPIAEGLKVPRLLEACPYFPAAIPHGKNAFDFYYQIHFEKYFKKLYEKKID